MKGIRNCTRTRSLRTMTSPNPSRQDLYLPVKCYTVPGKVNHWFRSIFFVIFRLGNVDMFAVFCGWMLLISRSVQPAMDIGCCGSILSGCRVGEFCWCCGSSICSTMKCLLLVRYSRADTALFWSRVESCDYWLHWYVSEKYMKSTFYNVSMCV